ACNSASGTISSVREWVASSTTLGAANSSAACKKRAAHRHQRSPGFSPGNRNSGRGVLRSLPRYFERARNSAVTMTQTVWRPTSSGPVLQQPSRKKPVNGAVEQDSSGVPRMLIGASIVISPQAASRSSGHGNRPAQGSICASHRLSTTAGSGLRLRLRQIPSTDAPMGDRRWYRRQQYQALPQPDRGARLGNTALPRYDTQAVHGGRVQPTAWKASDRHRRGQRARDAAWPRPGLPACAEAVRAGRRRYRQAAATRREWEQADADPRHAPIRSAALRAKAVCRATQVRGRQYRNIHKENYY